MPGVEASTEAGGGDSLGAGADAAADDGADDGGRGATSPPSGVETDFTVLPVGSVTPSASTTGPACAVAKASGEGGSMGSPLASRQTPGA
jgi:hypothetical protein